MRRRCLAPGPSDGPACILSGIMFGNEPRAAEVPSIALFGFASSISPHRSGKQCDGWLLRILTALITGCTFTQTTFSGSREFCESKSHYCAAERNHPQLQRVRKGCVKKGGVWIEPAGVGACAVAVTAPTDTIDREQSWQMKEERQAATVEMQQTVSAEIEKASKTIVVKCDEGQERATGARQKPGAGDDRDPGQPR